MSEQQAEEGFAFTVIEDDGQDVVIEVSEEDLNARLASKRKSYSSLDATR